MALKEEQNFLNNSSDSCSMYSNDQNQDNYDDQDNYDGFDGIYRNEVASDPGSNILNLIQHTLPEYKLDGYLISSRDEFNSEYTPDFNKRLQAASGFSGSFGLAVIMKDFGILYTDGRYMLQAKSQIDTNYFLIKDYKELLSDSKSILHHKKIGYDPRIFGDGFIKNMSAINLVPIVDNLVDKNWEHRPQKENLHFYSYAIKYTGQETSNKLNRLLKEIQDIKNQEGNQMTKSLFISLDPLWICWLLNIRGRDVKHTPVLLCYMTVQIENEKINKINLYTDSQCSNPDEIDNLIVLRQINDFYQDIALAKNNEQVCFLYEDERLNNSLISSILDDANIIRYNADRLRMWPSCKNKTEILWMKNGHINDAVALIEAFAYLEYSDQILTEYEFGEKLSEFRHQVSLKDFSKAEYISESFSPICGFKSNGAIIHYKAEKDTALPISGSGLFLIDSGGQYKGATTDITRVIPFGNPTEEEIELYTRVLMGHIDLSTYEIENFNINSSYTQAFKEMDSLARHYLKEIGLDYNHGTGHGVGSFLSVHEAPISIHKNSNIPIKEGMVFSNEPGVYLENKFGIRIENLMYTEFILNNNDKDIGTLKLNNLTLVPYSKKLINVNMLQSRHKKYLREYYVEIYEKIHDKLSNLGLKWLEAQIDIDI